MTLHHNLFEGIGQRTPRVRYGQVHIYNNLYYIAANTGFPVRVGRRRAVVD